MKDLICYCFEYSGGDIERDFVENQGESRILQKIVFEKKSGKCDCAQKNPKGR